MRCATAVLSAIVFVAGCSEFDLKGDPDAVSGPAPDIVVNPTALLYGTLSSGEDEVQTFEVSNIGEATLNVSNVVIGSGIAYRVLGPQTVFDLEPGESTTVDVSFTPLGADENYGQVRVLSDDPDTPEATVDLLGYGAVPELQIDPWSWVFTDAVIPCGGTKDLELKNVGNENLVIDNFGYSSGGILTLDSGTLRSQLPLTLAPGEFRTVTVNFNPTDVGADLGVLEVSSNDPRGTLSADQNGEGAYGNDNSESFTEPGVPPVDVMMLIDHSCSMEDANTNDVEDGIPDFVAELQLVSDWNLIQVTKESGCSNGGILDSSTPNADQLLINNAWNKENGFGDARTEALLEHAHRALGLTGPGQCNEGFGRPGALMHIIVMSDERERSGQTANYWVNLLNGFVVAPDFLKISAIVDLNRSCGDGSGAVGYEEAADLTGGVKLNICNATWGQQFGSVASDVLAGIRTYNLSDPAVESTIVVIVNGTPTTDFSYSAAGNSVTINSPAVGSGDLVEISYSVLGEC